MTHDPLCPNNDPRVQAAVASAMQSVGAMPTGYCQFCPVIARVREDEGGKREVTYVWDQDEVDAMRQQGYAAALRDAVEAVKLSLSADIELVERSQVIADIEALGGER